MTYCPPIATVIHFNHSLCVWRVYISIVIEPNSSIALTCKNINANNNIILTINIVKTKENRREQK